MTLNSFFSESKIGEILEKQKGFPYELKKNGKKYYIYNIGKGKAFGKGVEELKYLKEIVKPFLEKNEWFKKFPKSRQIKIVGRYKRKLMETLDAKS
tara:strand:- start:351 stop:638 length:288 start_codon:yes stop_codon:yes gene_type:complete